MIYKFKGGYFSMQKDITRLDLKVKDGRTLSLFYNKKLDLFVADVINKNEKGGIEFQRRKVKDIKGNKKEIMEGKNG